MDQEIQDTNLTSSSLDQYISSGIDGLVTIQL